MRIFSAAAAIAGWLALALQYRLAIGARGGAGLGQATIDFFSYFTVLTNILVAAELTRVALSKDNGGAWCRPRPVVATVIAVYATMTGLTYFLVLRRLWNPTGWLFVADGMLHYVMPVVFVAYWLCFVPNRTLGFRHAALSLVFPLAYIAYTLWHGAVSGFYPYPFVDASKLTAAQFVRNAGVLTAAFAALGIVYVAVAKLLGRLERVP
jgi:hypothetical protein